MIAKSDSVIEKLRKPTSKLFACLLILVAMLSVPRGFEDGLHEFFEYTGYLLLIVAALGRIWCSIYIAGRKDRELCVVGPYSLCRNPLYLFSFIGVVGIFSGLQSLLLGLICCTAYLVYYRFVIESEEKRLACLFGNSFESYLESTPRFVPSFRSFHRQESVYHISPRVIEKGLTEVFWFLAAILIIDLLELVHHQGWFVILHLPF